MQRTRGEGDTQAYRACNTDRVYGVQQSSVVADESHQSTLARGSRAEVSTIGGGAHGRVKFTPPRFSHKGVGPVARPSAWVPPFTMRKEGLRSCRSLRTRCRIGAIPRRDSRGSPRDSLTRRDSLCVSHLPTAICTAWRQGCTSLSRSCRCRAATRRVARRLAGPACAARGPKSSASSLLASARRSAERYETLTHDSSHMSPSESSPSHSTRTSNGRPRRPSCRRIAMMRRTAQRPPSSASRPATTGAIATRCLASRLLRDTSCLLRLLR